MFDTLLERPGQEDEVPFRSLFRPTDDPGPTQTQALIALSIRVILFGILLGVIAAVAFVLL